MNSKITEKDIDSMMAFVAAVTDVCKEIGKEYIFSCPICNGKARAIRAVYNGHCTGFCPSCRTQMSEQGSTTIQIQGVGLCLLKRMKTRSMPTA